MKTAKYYINRQEVSNIVWKIKENCQFIPFREVRKWEKILKDRYFSIKDIETLLKSISEWNKAHLIFNDENA